MSGAGFFRRHRSLVTVGSIVLAVALIVVVTIRLSQDEGGSSGQKDAPAASVVRPSLAGAAAELTRLLEAGTKLGFDGRYTVSSSGPPGTVRLWSRPPFLRVDTERGSGAELRRSAQFSLPSGTVGCNRQADGPWTCKAQPGLPIGAGLVPEAFVAQLAHTSVEARNAQVGDREARCFALSGSSGKGDVCLTPDGIPLRFQALSTTIELVELDRSPPPEEIFEPPAPLS